MTAAQLLQSLRDSGQWEVLVEKHHREEEERERRASEWRRAEAPLVEDLRAAGFAVESAWDLVNTSTPYPGAIPILLRHLRRDYPDAVREGIARALATPDARPGWHTCVELFRKETQKRAKDGLAAAIAAAADDSVLAELVALAREPAHGTSRVLLLSALERSRDPRARPALEQLARDPDLTKEAAVILKRMGSRGQ